MIQSDIRKSVPLDGRSSCVAMKFKAAITLADSRYCRIKQLIEFIKFLANLIPVHGYFSAPFSRKIHESA